VSGVDTEGFTWCERDGAKSGNTDGKIGGNAPMSKGRTTVWRRVRFRFARVLKERSAPWLSIAVVTLAASTNPSKGPIVTS